MKPDATGGCLCGQVRYAFDPDGSVTDYCHCVTCRKASGALGVAWVQVVPAAFRVTKGEPAAYRSSRDNRRFFCSGCGSPLFMADDPGNSIGILVGSLDDPEAFRPIAHGFDQDRVSWFILADDLPRHPGPPPHDQPDPPNTL